VARSLEECASRRNTKFYFTISSNWPGAKIFLLNSPTAAVDVGAKAEIYELIRILASEGAAVIFSSTEVEEFPALCERVLIFSGGRIAGELTGDGVTEANIMTIAVGGIIGGHRD
jgi:ABC-type sugar transport system ATPase subunit